MVAFKKAGLGRCSDKSSLLAAGVLGHSLGALADCVLGKFTGQVQPHGSLDLSAGDGVLPVVVGQTRGLCSDPLEDVVHEGVHDAHGLAGDASVGVHLLQDLVDVDGVALLSGLLFFFASPPLGFSEAAFSPFLLATFPGIFGSFGS